tara:strand:+ start:246 stop:896 length:651 start_codon:yes stop_codon:yes gene_type:complete
MYVGITVQNINHPNYSEKGHYLNVRWQDFAEASGFTLIPLTSVSLADQMIREKYIQAIILSGGGNLSKNFYNKNLLKKNTNSIDLHREIIEKRLIKYSLEINIPLIGICRGMQALAMYFGSQLYRVEKHVKTRHVLDYHCPVLEKNIIRKVNSYHDYGVMDADVPKGFKIHVKYLNTVEQMIHDNQKMLGIMWHPEREDKFSNLDIELFRKFLGIK